MGAAEAAQGRALEAEAAELSRLAPHMGEEDFWEVADSWAVSLAAPDLMLETRTPSLRTNVSALSLKLFKASLCRATWFRDR